MPHDTPTTTILIVASAVLFFCLGIAILVIMDHKARMPGGFKRDLFSVSGMRRDHPVEAFLTASILLGIIVVLVLEISVALAERYGLLKDDEEPPALLAKLAEERTAERLRHFHNLPAEDAADEGTKTVCFYCHGDYPHSKERMIRTLLNMHTQFIGCMTCHADDRKVPEERLTLRWLNFSGIEVQGEPFGTDVDPHTGYLTPTDDYYSKIVAYVRRPEGEELLEITESDPRAQEFVAVQDKLSDRDREAVKKSFHRLVSPKGRFCTRCHAEEDESYIPFDALGFTDRRISDLTNLSIIGLVQKYKTFYMPNLLKSDKPLPEMEVLTGPERQAPQPKTDMGKDPRRWWRETYDPPK